MRKLIATINMTVDGFCDHTAGIADDEILEHYTELLGTGDTILYGRITYQLMEFWKPIAEDPTGEKAVDDFAAAVENIKKIVYSRTLLSVDWKNTELKREVDKGEILNLKQQTGKDMFVGSPGMILALGGLGLIDEYQLGIHPLVIGSGLPLFKSISERIDLRLLTTKTLRCGVVFLYYEPTIR